MAKIKLAFIGYSEDWTIERMKKAAPADVDVVGVPSDPQDTFAERARAAAEDAEVIVPWRFPVTADVGKAKGKLKLVQALSAGTDYLPKKDLAARGVMVANNRGANAVAVAEYAVLLMVAAYRHLARQVRQIETGHYHEGFFETWERYHELTGKRVGIIGLGQIGSRVAKRLAGWECEVVYHDKAEIDPALEKACNAKRVSLDELLRTSDIVTLHVPLNESTRGMMSDAQFAAMKPDAILVNTCRGPVVDEAALIRALNGGAIAGAGLDVTEIEPILMDNPLLKMDNVFLGPHLAGMSIEARYKALEFAAYNAGRVAKGLKPEGLIAPDE